MAALLSRVRSSSSTALVLLLLLSLAACVAADCSSVEAYYGDLYDDLVALSRPFPALADDLNALLVSTHTVVSYGGAWDALAELDRDPDQPDNVLLVYSEVSVPATQHSDATGWNREHLWPRSYGLGDSGPDYSDLHNLRACDWNVNSARGNLYYGFCDPAVDASCTSPAHVEAGPDTAKNSQLFLADSARRGDIARAAMYMALRYRGTETNTLSLTLSNCPCPDAERFGNLTTLHNWHTNDPVDSREELRNQLTCENWQHNRNPFVDFPDLVDYYYSYMKDEGLLEAGCGEPCDDSTGEDDDESDDPCVEDCNLEVGDVVVLGYNSNDPDEVYLSPLVDLAPGLKFTITDGGWEGTALRPTEGFAEYTTPPEGVAAGTIILYTGITGAWSGTALSLSLSGDQVLVFQGKSESPEFVFAVDFNGGWAEPGSSTSTSASQLPPGLAANSSVSLPKIASGVYSGITSGTRAELLDAITKPDNWQTSSDRLTYDDELNVEPDNINDDPNDDTTGDDDDAATTASNPAALVTALLLSSVAAIWSRA